MFNPRQFEIYFVELDPTIGFEINKARPCLIISPDIMNENIQTLIIAPLTTKSHNYPTRVPTTLKGKEGYIVLDQIRTIDKKWLHSYLGRVDPKTIILVKSILKEIFE